MNFLGVASKNFRLLRCLRPAAARGALSFARRYVRRVIILLFFFSPPIWAINPETYISQYGHSVWRIQDGYFHGRPQAITQTADGYLWVGTEAGLLRFDGVNFVPWTPPLGQQLPSSSIRSLHASADGSLWIGTTSGLSHLHGQILTNFNLRGPIGSILEDSDHSVWLVYGSANGSVLCHIAETVTQCYEKNDGVPDNAVGALIRDSAGNIWLGALHGLVRWRPGSFSVLDASALRSYEGSDGVETIAFANARSILVGISMPGRGLGLQQFIIDTGIWKPYRKAGFDGTTLNVAALFSDREGSLWIGTLHQGMFRVQGEHVEHNTNSGGLSGDYIRDFYEDREGNLWVITSNGVDLFRDLQVVSFSTREGLGTEEVESVMASRDGTIWVGGADSLDVIRNGIVSSIRAGKGLPGGQVGALFEDHAGRLWVGVDQNLFIYENGVFKPIKRADGNPMGAVKTVTEDRDNNIWVATRHGSSTGLLLIRDFKVEKELWSPQIPSFRQIVADLNGNLWLALLSGGLARLNDSHVESVAFPGTTDSPIEQLILAADRSVLGGTASGVVAWNNNTRRILTEQDGLPCNHVHGLINDARGNLWLNMQCGLVEVTEKELKKWWEKSDPLHPRVFNSFDGAQAGRAFWSSATRSADGRLWFANGTVLQMIDPARLVSNNLAPPVHVERIIGDRKSYPTQNGVTIPPLTRDLEIDYTALSFGVPQKVFYRYKLEGRDTQWIEANTRREAFYNDLRPGSYRFHVIACNKDGVWNEAGATLQFSVLPAFYQTTWFRVLCAFGFLVLLWSMYQLRIHQMQRQFNVSLDARVNERTRIARELHDTLLQNFHGLMFQFQAARNLMTRRPDEAMQSLDDAIRETKRAITEGRAAIQGLRSETVAKGNLAELLISMSPELTNSNSNEHPPVFDIIEEGEQQVLSPSVSNEICRIAVELVRNAYQHAHAQRIEAEIRYGDSMFRLRIRDDGQGIEPQVLKEGGRAGHWGLRGVRERADQIGARLDLWSEPERGTEVQLLVPASIAYENRRDGYGAKLFRRVRSRAERS